MLRFLYGQDTTQYPDERQRVQQAFLMQIMAYSALRPSSTTAAKKRKLGPQSVAAPRKTARHTRRMAESAPSRDASTPLENIEPQDDGRDEARLEEAEVRVKYGDFRLFLVLDDEGQTRLGIQPQYKHYKGERRRQQM